MDVENQFAPKGHSQPSQGHALGESEATNQPQRGCVKGGKPWHGMEQTVCVGLTQPRWGWVVYGHEPRVAVVLQPWAGGRNPVGIRSALRDHSVCTSIC